MPGRLLGLVRAAGSPEEDAEREEGGATRHRSCCVAPAPKRRKDSASTSARTADEHLVDGRGRAGEHEGVDQVGVIDVCEQAVIEVDRKTASKGRPDARRAERRLSQRRGPSFGRRRRGDRARAHLGPPRGRSARRVRRRSFISEQAGLLDQIDHSVAVAAERDRGAGSAMVDRRDDPIPQIGLGGRASADMLGPEELPISGVDVDRVDRGEASRAVEAAGVGEGRGRGLAVLREALFVLPRLLRDMGVDHQIVGPGVVGELAELLRGHRSDAVRGQADLDPCSPEVVDPAKIGVDRSIAEASLLRQRSLASAGATVEDLEQDQADADLRGRADDLPGELVGIVVGRSVGPDGGGSGTRPRR